MTPPAVVLASADPLTIRAVSAAFEEEGVPLLVMANKQDLLSALSAADISVGLNLTAIRDRPWQIQACSAKSGDGVQAGFEWLVKCVADRKPK